MLDAHHTDVGKVKLLSQFDLLHSAPQYLSCGGSVSGVDAIALVRLVSWAECATPRQSMPLETSYFWTICRRFEIDAQLIVDVLLPGYREYLDVRNMESRKRRMVQ